MEGPTEGVCKRPAKDLVHLSSLLSPSFTNFTTEVPLESLAFSQSVGGLGPLWFPTLNHTERSVGIVLTGSARWRPDRPSCGPSVWSTCSRRLFSASADQVRAFVQRKMPQRLRASRQVPADGPVPFPSLSPHWTSSVALLTGLRRGG